MTGKNQVSLMNNLEVSCTLNEGKEMLELSKNIAKNEMLITINKKPNSKLPTDYEFCFSESK